MKVTYFKDTDTLLVTFSNSEVVDTKDINENTIIDLDAKGNLVAITIEHATKQTEVSSFSFDQITKLTA
ncbi:DUF2283 domain-containing protein [Paucihalobacter ruber]|uniref:DUF2283 domain-containing protein n=1 Tax=Paucihalobacter ruber TaxID=2567861 RepID=A0A506PR33_9FLAO|nr:DUF2283 domain-containing protein [Paucihalobacter ruber]TPV35958.1 DUF2283 domain-containing protein [Paucihalobacter ruber]